MNYQDIDSELTRIATSTPGVIACALVAMDTGMIYLSSSRQTQFEMIAECARDYWALHVKNQDIFIHMGNIHNIFIQHEHNLLSIQPCGTKMILVTQAKLKEVDWGAWPKVISPLKGLIKKFENTS